MNERKMCGMIGLAVRARQAAAGMEACRIMIRSGQCGVLLADGKISTGSRQKAEGMARQGNVPFRVLPSGMILAAAGRDNMIVAIRQGSFAEQIISMLPDL